MCENHVSTRVGYVSSSFFDGVEQIDGDVVSLFGVLDLCDERRELLLRHLQAAGLYRKGEPIGCSSLTTAPPPLKYHLGSQLHRR